MSRQLRPWFVAAFALVVTVGGLGAILTRAGDTGAARSGWAVMPAGPTDSPTPSSTDDPVDLTDPGPTNPAPTDPVFTDPVPTDPVPAATGSEETTPASGAHPSTQPPAVSTRDWTLMWSPEADRDGLGAFEGVEDDRAHSDPGVKHIYVQGNDYRFDMHTRDRDGSDRQRNEVKGMRSGGRILTMQKGETWRFTYSMYIPSSLMATTTFTHIMQMKMPGDGTGPIVVMSLRRYGSTPKIELKIFEPDILVGAVDLQPLQNKWIGIQLDITIGDAPAGAVHWVVRDGARTVIDASKSRVDTWLGDRVRPKWGIYRSLGDTSGSLRDCYLLLTNMRAYRHT